MTNKKNKLINKTILFLVCLFAFVLAPMGTKAASYQFSFDAYVCGGSTAGSFTDCKASFYAGSLSKLNANTQLDTGTTIMLVLNYDHDFIEEDASSPEYYGNGAGNAQYKILYNSSAVKVTEYVQGRGTALALYGALDAANPAFSGFEYALDASAPLWTVTPSDDGTQVTLLYSPANSTETFTYNPGPLGFMFFTVKSDAASGTAFDFKLAPSGGDGTVLSAQDGEPINWTQTSIAFNVTGTTTSTDATLKSLSAVGSNGENYKVYKDNTYATEFTTGSTETTYYMVVPSDVTSITLNSEVNDSQAKFVSSNTTTYSVLHNLNALSTNQTTEISFYVQPESTTALQTQYKVKVYRLSDDFSLNNLKYTYKTAYAKSDKNYSTGTVIYASGVYEESREVYYQSTKTRLTPTATHTNATITTVTTSDIGNTALTSDIALNKFGPTNPNVLTIHVQAENCLAKYSEVPGNTCSEHDYTLNVKRQNPSTDVTLNTYTTSMVINEVTQTRTVTGFTSGTSTNTFNFQDKDGNSFVPYATTSVTIAATATDANAVVNIGSNPKSLAAGTNNAIKISVTAEDGTTTQEYTVNIYRRNNVADAFIDVVSTPAGSLDDPTITGTTYTYKYNYPKTATQVIVKGKPNDANANIAFDCTTCETSVDEDGITLVTYPLTGDNAKTRATIIVTAEDGNTKTHIINFAKILSTDSTLSALSVSNLSNETPIVLKGEGLVAGEFDPEVTTYTALVAGVIEKIHINATLNQADAEFATIDEVTYGPRDIDLDYGPNTINVIINSEKRKEDSSVQPGTYTIVITRQEKDVKTLASVEIAEKIDPDGGNDDSNFRTLRTCSLSEGAYSCGEKLPFETTEVYIRAVVTEGSEATYAVYNQQGGLATNGKVSLNVDDNNFTIRVTAQNTSTADYTVTVGRKRNTEAGISRIILFEEYEATWDAVNERYNVTVGNSHKDLYSTDINVVTLDPNAEPQLKGTKTTLTTADTGTLYDFSVKAQDRSVEEPYKLLIIREKSDDNTLGSVSILTDQGVTKSCTTFTNYECTISVDSITTGFTLTATPTDSAATIREEAEGEDPIGEGYYTMGAGTSSMQVQIYVRNEKLVEQLYKVNIERGRSTVDTLDYIKIDGVIVKDFDGAKKQTYDIEVAGTTEAITLTAAVTDTGKATITFESGEPSYEPLNVTKNLAYEPAINTFKILVTSESGSPAVKEYTINITRKKNDNRNISSIKIGANALSGFASNAFNYAYNDPYYAALDATNQNQLRVDYFTTSIMITGVAEDSKHGRVKIKLGDQEEISAVDTPTLTKALTLKPGANVIHVYGVAYNGTEFDYALTVYRELDSRTILNGVKVVDGEDEWIAEYIEPTDTVPGYFKVELPNKIKQLSSANVVTTVQTVALEGDPEARTTMGVRDLTTDPAGNNYSIIVTAPSGGTQTYKLLAIRAKSGENRLSSLSIPTGSIKNVTDPVNPSDGFDPDGTTFDVTLPTSATHYSINYVLMDSSVKTVTGAGGPHLLTGTNMTVTVKVVAENDDERVYTFNLKRNQSSDNTLSGIAVNSGGTAFKFVDNNGNEVLFSPETTDYTVKVPGSYTQINIAATATDEARTQVTGDLGVHYVSYTDPNATNHSYRYKITATPETGSARDYYVNVVMLPKVDNTLNSLKVIRVENDGTRTELSLDQTFDPEVTIYRLPKQKYGVTTLYVEAETTDSDAVIIEGAKSSNNDLTGEHSLSTGAQILIVKVNAQDPSVKTKEYKLYVEREQNDDATLQSLDLGVPLIHVDDPEATGFQKNVLEYNAILDSGATTLKRSSVTAIASDSQASVVKFIPDPNDEDNSLTELELTTTYKPFYVKVTAEDGETKLTYTINVKRAESNEAKLSSVELIDASIGAFSPNTTTYTVNVGNSKNSFKIKGIPVDSRAEVLYNPDIEADAEGYVTYPSTTSQVEITVNSEDGSNTKTYTFNIITAEALDNTLASLSVQAYPFVGTNKTFNKTETLYDIGNVPSSTAGLTINATTTNPEATIEYYVNGILQSGNIVQLPVGLGEGSITLRVIPAVGISGGTKDYSIAFDKVASNNNYLQMLTPSSGSLNQPFTKTNTSYTMTVPNATTSISFRVQTEDSEATVTNTTADNKVFAYTTPVDYSYDNLVVGTNIAKFTVYPRSGSPKEYTVTITRANPVASPDTNLQRIEVDNHNFIDDGGNTVPFNTTTKSYKLGAIPFSEKTLTIRTTKNYAGQTVQYLLNGVDVTPADTSEATLTITGKTGENMLAVHVIAANGIDNTNYEITFSRTPSNNAYLESMVDSLGKITGFNGRTTTQVSINVDSTVTSLPITLVTEESHATISINGEVRTHQWAYTASNLVGGDNRVVITVTAESNDTKTYTLIISKEGSSELITSRVFGHKIEDGMIKSAILDSSLLDLKNQLDNDNSKLQIWLADGTQEINDLNTKVATGQIVKLVDPNTGNVLDSKLVIVLGDTDGNGSITLFDSVKIVNHFLKKDGLMLSGASLAAADVDKNGSITLFDSVKIVNHFLKKEGLMIDYTVSN